MRHFGILIASILRLFEELEQVLREIGLLIRTYHHSCLAKDCIFVLGPPRRRTQVDSSFVPELDRPWDFSEKVAVLELCFPCLEVSL
tara:strand:- start:289 stop:549 length:261 start_codon:yes stop_codon:yes gene_type:complete